jgi:hypothetical protein
MRFRQQKQGGYERCSRHQAMQDAWKNLFEFKVMVFAAEHTLPTRRNLSGEALRKRILLAGGQCGSKW